MTFRVLDEWAIDSTLDQFLRQSLQAAFPVDQAIFAVTRAWNCCAPSFTILFEDDTGKLIAHGGVHERVIRIQGEAVRVAGFQNVFVNEPFRGRGRVDQLLQRMLEESARRNFDVAMLFCKPQLIKTYARTNWVYEPDRSVINITASGTTAPVAAINQMMWHPLIRPDLPAGPVDLRGYDW